MTDPSKWQGMLSALAERGVMKSKIASQSAITSKTPSFRNLIRFRLGLRDEGQALAETALVFPVILILITGILIFGIFIMQMMSLTEGVSNAGRVLSVSAGQTTDPCALTATSLQSAAPLLVKANLSYSITLTPPGGSATTYNGASCSSADTTTGAAGKLLSGGVVSITASYSQCSLAFFGNNLMPGGCSISRTITEAVQ